MREEIMRTVTLVVFANAVVQLNQRLQAGLHIVAQVDRTGAAVGKDFEPKM